MCSKEMLYLSQFGDFFYYYGCNKIYKYDYKEHRVVEEKHIYFPYELPIKHLGYNQFLDETPNYFTTHKIYFNPQNFKNLANETDLNFGVVFDEIYEFSPNSVSSIYKLDLVCKNDRQLQKIIAFNNELFVIMGHNLYKVQFSQDYIITKTIRLEFVYSLNTEYSRLNIVSNQLIIRDVENSIIYSFDSLGYLVQNETNLLDYKLSYIYQTPLFVIGLSIIDDESTTDALGIVMINQQPKIVRLGKLIQCRHSLTPQSHSLRYEDLQISSQGFVLQEHILNSLIGDKQKDIVQICEKEKILYQKIRFLTNQFNLWFMQKVQQQFDFGDTDKLIADWDLIEYILDYFVQSVPMKEKLSFGDIVKNQNINKLNINIVCVFNLISFITQFKQLNPYTLQLFNDEFFDILDKLVANSNLCHIQLIQLLQVYKQNSSLSQHILQIKNILNKKQMLTKIFIQYVIQLHQSQQLLINDKMQKCIDYSSINSNIVEYINMIETLLNNKIVINLLRLCSNTYILNQMKLHKILVSFVCLENASQLIDVVQLIISQKCSLNYKLIYCLFNSYDMNKYWIDEQNKIIIQQGIVKYYVIDQQILSKYQRTNIIFNLLVNLDNICQLENQKLFFDKKQIQQQQVDKSIQDIVNLIIRCLNYLYVLLIQNNYNSEMKFQQIQDIKLQQIIEQYLTKSELMMAVKCQNEDIVKFLIQKINMTQQYYEQHLTALCQSLYTDNYKIYSMLLVHEQYLRVGKQEQSMLMYCVENMLYKYIPLFIHPQCLHAAASIQDKYHGIQDETKENRYIQSQNYINQLKQQGLQYFGNVNVVDNNNKYASKILLQQLDFSYVLQQTDLLQLIEREKKLLFSYPILQSQLKNNPELLTLRHDYFNISYKFKIASQQHVIQLESYQETDYFNRTYNHISQIGCTTLICSDTTQDIFQRNTLKYFKFNKLIYKKYQIIDE